MKMTPPPPPPPTKQTMTERIRAAVEQALMRHAAALDARGVAWSGVNIFVKVADRGRDKGAVQDVVVRPESHTTVGDLP